MTRYLGAIAGASFFHAPLPSGLAAIVACFDVDQFSLLKGQIIQ
jgi:hypothetical protein